MSSDPRFEAILRDISQLHGKKSADYGRGEDTYANVRASQEFGIAPWAGAMVRANDKMTRIKSHCLNGRLENESLEDSLIDLATYAIIALLLFREGGKANRQKEEAGKEGGGA